MFSYSYLNASIGLSLDALLAGRMPKIMPMNAENPTPMIMTIGLTVAVIGDHFETIIAPMIEVQYQQDRQLKLMSLIQ